MIELTIVVLTLALGIAAGLMLGENKGYVSAQRDAATRIQSAVTRSKLWYESPRAEKYRADDYNSHEAAAFWSGALQAAEIVLEKEAQ